MSKPNIYKQSSLWLCDYPSYFSTVFFLFLVCKQSVIIAPWHQVSSSGSRPWKLLPPSSLSFSLGPAFSETADLCVIIQRHFSLSIKPLSHQHHVFWILPSVLLEIWTKLSNLGYRSVFPWPHCKCLSERDRKNLFFCLVLGYYWRLINVAEKLSWGWGMNVSFCASAHLPESFSRAKCCPFTREILSWMVLGLAASQKCLTAQWPSPQEKGKFSLELFNHVKSTTWFAQRGH